MKKNRRLLSMIQITFLLPMLLLSVAGCHSLQSASHPAPAASRESARFYGTLMWDKNPVRRAALFLQATRKDGTPRGREVEFLTRSDGTFDAQLPPGHYRLRSSPTTLCPLKGEIDLTPGDNHYQLSVHSLSFLTCVPGTIKHL